MNPDILESHILTIEKFIQNTEETAKKLSEISIKQLNATAQRLLNGNQAQSTPITSIMLKNWRDDSIALQSPSLGLFNLKRKHPSRLGSSKLTEHKNLFKNTLDTEEEVCENSSDCENEEIFCTNWAQQGKTHWEKGISKYDPDELFNPATTPNGKGFVCNLQDIFPQKKFKNTCKRPSRADWNN
jgi:methionine aminopeptidase